MKISYAMNVLNGEPFIWYQLKSIYKHAHEIIIVEGAYKKFAYAARGFRSTDTTLDSIKKFPDPECKIKLIARDYYYDDRVGMCNEFMKDLTGDILWQVDVDEFYCDETHRFVKQLFDNMQDLDQISFNFVDYYAGLDFVIKGYDESLLDVVRVNRIHSGMRWLSQRPPTLEVDGVKLIPKKKISGKEMLLSGHLMHNATMLFDEQVKNKFTYYKKMWPNSIADTENWFSTSWIEFESKFCVAGLMSSLTYLVPRTFALPEGLEKMQISIMRGFYKDVELSTKKIQFKISQDHEYENKILAAEVINKIKASSITSFLPTAIDAIIKVLSLSRSIDKKNMRHVIVVSIRSRAYNFVRIALKAIKY